MKNPSTPNRVMLLTPPGSAAVAVVRMMGPGTDDFLKQHFSRAVHIGKRVHGNLTDGSRILDDPLVVRIDDETIDLNLHGGPWVVRATIELAERFEFVLTNDDPARFDAACSLEREVLEFLPRARTELAIRSLLAQSEAWRKAKDDPGFNPQHVLEDRALQHLLGLPRVAIVGPANVGKSTLANQLFAQERSITADVPGTTRDWVGEIANIDGLAVMLVDTPGLRDTADAIEQAAIEASAQQIRAADLVVLVLDAYRPLDPEQVSLLEQFPEALRVINRCDLPNAWDIASMAGVRTVAIRGEGIDALRREILARFGLANFDCERARVWTHRQREILIRAKTHPDALDDFFM